MLGSSTAEAVEIETPTPPRRGQSGADGRTQHDGNLRDRGAPRVRGTRHDGHGGGVRVRSHACCRDQPIGRSHAHGRRGTGSDHDSRGRRATADRPCRGPQVDADRPRVSGRNNRTDGCVVRPCAWRISSNRLKSIRTRTGSCACAHARSLRVTAADVSPGHLAPRNHTAHHDPATTADDRRELSVS